MKAVSNALIRSRALRTSAYYHGAQLKASGNLGGLLDIAPSAGLNQLGQFRDDAANRQRYSLFRGHVHAAINAICMEASGQSVKVGRVQKKKELKKRKDLTNRMTRAAREKAANEELEVLEGHELQKSLENPNPIQTKADFVYSFIANLCLTGWSYIVGDKKKEGGYEFYCIPTTWVKPDHSKGAFAEIRVVNPKNPTAQQDGEPLDRTKFAFARLPNPADPMAALAPAHAQMMAIRIDDHIQTSQDRFFDNALLPSAIITIGTNPHPDARPGSQGRPRLTAVQRRQVHAAIRKLMSGVANYGNPAIIDGYIEKIERLSSTQNEIGWEKSEKTVRSRILSAFGVHPFILGEDMAGSYAQAYIVQDRFFKRVNSFLDMLGVLMTSFIGMMEADEDLLVWWEELRAEDPSMKKGLWEQARTRKDITQNEFRAEMLGLPPDEDGNEDVIDRAAAPHVTAIAASVKKGDLDPEQGKAILEGLGIPSDLAERIAPKDIEVKQPPAPAPGFPGGPPQAPGQASQNGKKPPKPKPGEELQQAQRSLDLAVAALTASPREIATEMLTT